MAEVTGGEKLQEYLQEMLKSGESKTLKFGFMRGETYPDGTSTAEVAAFNEFGTANSPPRPFVRNMIATNKGDWPKQLVGLIKEHDYDVNAVLDDFGKLMVEQLRESIFMGKYAPLSPVTVAKKGHAQPLIDTFHMVDSISYEVE
jgi:hypothetical protein